MNYTPVNLSCQYYLHSAPQKVAKKTGFSKTLAYETMTRVRGLALWLILTGNYGTFFKLDQGKDAR
jgi:hypothetical protein